VSWVYALHDRGLGYPWDCPLHERRGLRCFIGEVRFARVFHLVRFPLHAIASLDTYKPSSWAFVDCLTDGSGLAPEVLHDPNQRILRCARHWVLWNKFVGLYAEKRFRTENLDPVDVCRKAGFGTRCGAANPAGTAKLQVNNRAHQKIEWAYLERLDPSLATTIKAMAAEYGYPLDFGDN